MTAESSITVPALLKLLSLYPGGYHQSCGFHLGEERRRAPGVVAAALTIMASARGLFGLYLANFRTTRYRPGVSVPLLSCNS